MAPDAQRPKRAAKAAALKNPVWLDRKAPTSVSTCGQEKRPHSPDGSSTSTKKARRVVGGVRKSLPKAAKSGNHVTTQLPVNAKAKHHPQGKSVVSRRHPVQINVDAESDDDGDRDDGDNDQSESDEREVMQHESEGENVSGEEQDDLFNLSPKDVRAAFERERAKWGVGTDPLPSLKRAKWGTSADVDGELDANAVDDSHINPLDKFRLKAGTANDALSDDDDCDRDENLESTKTLTFSVNGEGLG
ncbi:hypothetical protein H4582DRAFT_2057802 [Lactarius indigo]|nr:hypothetical protein H4582DRAFT_2057802 [Lactarius indigo]